MSKPGFLPLTARKIHRASTCLCSVLLKESSLKITPSVLNYYISASKEMGLLMGLRNKDFIPDKGKMFPFCTISRLALGLPLLSIYLKPIPQVHKRPVHETVHLQVSSA